MASTFFGLNISSSALSSFQASVNTAANNIANVKTAGYSKQVANLAACDPIRTNAKYGMMGAGVNVTSIKQLRDSYYDTKYWRNQSSVGLYEKRLYYLDQIQTMFTDDDTSKGFSSIFSTLFNNMDALQHNSADTSVRNQFISGAQNLTNYFNSVATQLSQLQNDINNEVKSTVDELNSTAQKIALLNKQINAIEIQGGYANELRDERALLVDSLSQIVPVEVEENPVTNSNYPDMYTGGTTYRIKIDGQTLVDTFEYHELAYTARENKINQTDVDGLYDLSWKETGVAFKATGIGATGTLAALFEIRDGNNKTNFNGTVGSDTTTFGTAVVKGRNVTTMTVNDPSITDINKLSIAAEGIITIKGNQYNYSNFAINKTAMVDDAGNPVLDADGNQKYSYSYTFTLEKELSSIEKGKIAGQKAEIGDSIDSMGVPYYMSQMSEFIRIFAKNFNSLQRGTDADPGVDLNGKEMGTFFIANNKVDGTEYAFEGNDVSSYSDTYYQMTALNFGVAKESVKDPSRIATMSKLNYTAGVDKYDIIENTLKLESETTMYRGCGASDFLQCMLSDVSVDTQEAELFQKNYSNIATSIETQRQSISGVDEDEEALDLVKFQNAYNLASKMIQVMSEMYDRLITQTGV